LKKNPYFDERRSDYFHSHIYFDAESRASADALQKVLLRELPSTVQVSRLVDRAIGPHPLPMFELGFHATNYPLVRTLLETHLGPHTALIHQVTPDEVWDHTEGAEWIGEPVKLNIQFLRDFMAGTTPGVSSTVPFERKSEN
jgi:aromatic ring-cleaving dioxygenase